MSRLVTLLDLKLQVFKKSPIWTIFGFFDELLSTQNVNVARFTRNVECDFLGDFQTLCDSRLWQCFEGILWNSSSTYRPKVCWHSFPLIAVFGAILVLRLGICNHAVSAFTLCSSSPDFAKRLIYHHTTFLTLCYHASLSTFQILENHKSRFT